jgi:hypothetical protein
MPFSTLTRTQRDCLSALRAEGVEFMIVGGYAVRFHGFMRPAEDLDLLISNERRNVEALKRFWLKAGAINVPYMMMVAQEEWGMVDWDDVDFLTAIRGGNFRKLRERAVSEIVEGDLTLIISKADLIAEREMSLHDQSQKERHECIAIDLDCLKAGGSLDA